MKTFGQLINENFVAWQDGEDIPNHQHGHSKITPEEDGKIDEDEYPSEYLFEKYLNDEEIMDLINKAGRASTDISSDKKKSKEERAKAKDVFDFVQSVRSTWRKEKSLHPSAVNALMRIVVGVSSSNKRGYGYKTKGFEKSPDGKVPKQYGEENSHDESFRANGNHVDSACTRRDIVSLKIHHDDIYESRGRGMTEALIKTTALATKRWIIQKGNEGNVSSQINGLAGLILLDMALSDRGESIISKSLAVSGLFKG